MSSLLRPGAAENAGSVVANTAAPHSVVVVRNSLDEDLRAPIVEMHAEIGAEAERPDLEPAAERTLFPPSALTERSATEWNASTITHAETTTRTVASTAIPTTSPGVSAPTARSPSPATPSPAIDRAPPFSLDMASEPYAERDHDGHARMRHMHVRPSPQDRDADDVSSVSSVTSSGMSQDTFGPDCTFPAMRASQDIQMVQRPAARGLRDRWMLRAEMKPTPPSARSGGPDSDNAATGASDASGERRKRRGSRGGGGGGGGDGGGAGGGGGDGPSHRSHRGGRGASYRSTEPQLEGIAAPGLTTGFAMLCLTTIGVVYGDLGTSPLYTVQSAMDDFFAYSDHLSENDIFGVASLIFWSLTIVPTIKYGLWVLQADNHGEIIRRVACLFVSISISISISISVYVLFRV